MNKETNYTLNKSDKQKDLPTIGGPPIGTKAIGSTGCTAGNYELYTDVQKSIDCVINDDSKPLLPGSLGYSVNLPTKEPFSCMIDLITGKYSDCGTKIPDDKLKSAYKVFTDITGYNPINLDKIFNDLSEQQKNIINFNSFYIFMPILILSLLGIILMAGFGWMNGYAALFLIVIVCLILGMFAGIYRSHGQNYINDTSAKLKEDANKAQSNYEDSIAYWPQGLFGVACSITSATGTTGWSCNETQSVNSKSVNSKIHRNLQPNIRNRNVGICKGNKTNCK